MNAIRAITYMSVRGYRRKVRRIRPDTVGIRGKIKMAKDTDPQRMIKDFEEEDPDDLAPFESDFSKADKYYDMHEWEVSQSREKLQHDITVKKYFKTVDPSFLTLIERDEMIKLHKDNPQEWTVERLSESFPILPEGVRKILKDKWKPKSIKKAVDYDRHIAENWKKFQAGKLSVSAELRDHLLKFGNREINLKDRHVLVERVVAPKMKFPEPKTKVFSTILDYIEDGNNKDKQSQNLLGQERTQMLAAPIESHKKCTEPSHCPEEVTNKDKSGYLKSKKMTFPQFVENKYKQISKESEEEAKVLMETYKKHTTNEEGTALTTKSNELNKGELTTLSLGDQPAIVVMEDKENSALGTYVAKWEKLNDIEPTYFYPIKIPKNAYQKGKIYRIGDCYYDEDGEFLYRVPGLRS